MTHPDDIRRQLLGRRRMLLEQVAHVEEDLHWLDTDVEPEREEEGQERNIARLLARLDDRGRAEIAEIDAALAAIVTGEYGVCHRCKEPIPPARLAALPTALTCVSCAAALERPSA